MSVFNLLTEKDKYLIETYIKTYGPTDPLYIDWSRYRGLPVVLQEWANNKDKYLKTLLNNQLILHHPYTYIAQTEAITHTIDNSLYNDDVPLNFSSWWGQLTYQKKDAIKITYLHSTQEHYSKWFWINSCMEPAVLAANAYQGENLLIEFPSGNKMKIFKGMRPMKIIQTFVKEFDGDEDLFEAFRIWHSRQLNQQKIDGELCLSIHPLDFMTMSDNDNNWTSCMRWAPNRKEDCTIGDFRGGTVSCMNSPYMIIAYLHNPNHKYHIPEDETWEWNSKQWRELFIVQDGIITEVKGYPFQDENLTNTCLKWIKDLANINLGWTYDDEEVNVSKEINIDNHTTLFTFQPGTFMYKDIGTLPIHRGRINPTNLLGKYDIQECYKPKEKEVWNTFIDIPYGGICTCMCCGTEIVEDTATDIVMCKKCDTIVRCYKCGRPIYGMDYYWVDEIDDPLCELCWQDEVIYDCFEDEPHLVENTKDIYLLLGFDKDNHPIWHDNIAYCYEPLYNWGYQQVLNSPPLLMDIGKGYHDYRNYVTLDMINEGKEQNFKEAFGIDSKDSFDKMMLDYKVIHPIF